MSSPDLIKILDLDKFTLREDKFKLGEESVCQKTISWKEHWQEIYLLIKMI